MRQRSASTKYTEDHETKLFGKIWLFKAYTRAPTV